MFVIDLQQVMMANLMVQIGRDGTLDESMLRHMILNFLRGVRNKFASDYGEMIIATDNISWRRTPFPYYKANRRKNRDVSTIDWTLIFDSFSKIRDELRDNFPYRVINVPGAEADDVIGVLAHTFGSDTVLGSEKILIVSGDKDFKQLQRYYNVEQYDPVRKKMVHCSDADEFLRDHIIRGDTGDGIPNILSADDCLTTGTRQATMTAKRVEYYMSTPFDQLKTEEQRNWKRNELLIDLNNTPADVKQQILDSYNTEAGKDRSRLFNYFITHKLKFLMENIGEF